MKVEILHQPEEKVKDEPKEVVVTDMPLPFSRVFVLTFQVLASLLLIWAIIAFIVIIIMLSAGIGLASLSGFFH